MNKWLQLGLTLTALLGAGNVMAKSALETFLDSAKGSAAFNCAYQGKIASRKCIVSHSMVKGSIHPMTKQIYGANTQLKLLTIKWPDGDVSRYVNVDRMELFNLGDNDSYRYKTLPNDEWKLDLRRGLILQGRHSDEHVRIW